MNIGLRVRSHRLRRRLSLRQVAERTGLSISFLSQVERDLAAPSISSLKQIATALEVSIAELLAEPNDAHRTVLRSVDRPSWSLARVRFELLATADGRRMEPQLITFDPGGDSGTHPITHEGEEFMFLLDGRLECLIGDEVVSLEEGDCAYFSSEVPHRMQNASSDACRCLLVVTPPSF
jgi:transcriptional regulator with XRE-family HTH domain